ncbi:UDP-N-acetylmuramate dehydrogenase [Herbiconiux ginsengi]|uniref:UDP-N-acetylenolpyruvoylglucosamine reductase n=1 Tax=Herbiconiux ginsengi TaxID=381665 RepID=A0A1H3NGH6_9MICO|nr:UDP-N-acetylmuramate dehydrogenase [Herbiconiux ginsengi]SDY87575.1 UDP-N-acetylmuramate dehydrogenase [Herbiconiux ginsengi]
MSDEATDVPLGPLTTLQVGGPAARFVTASTEPELLDVVRETWASNDDWFVLGGGSNVVVADEGFDGTVIRVATRGIAPVMSKVGTVRLRVQAGEPWDDFVRHTVENGWSGIEALSGIPGSVGAAPIQNIGAYGQEVASAIVSLDFLDFGTGAVRRMPLEELELSYRSSVFKRGLRGVVLSVTFQLRDAWGDSLEGPDSITDAVDVEGSGASGALSEPVMYAQLASALGIELGERMPIDQVRGAVLWLRGSKGMVLDAADPDSVSAGSFFTNPIVTEHFARTLPPTAPRWQIEPDEPDTVIPLEDGMEIAVDGDRSATALPEEYHVKLSAAWLIENAGLRRGFALPGSTAAISSKHTLAIVNTAAATASGRAADVSELARYVQGRVLAEFGVLLQPEPVFLGHEL